MTNEHHTHDYHDLLVAAAERRIDCIEVEHVLNLFGEGGIEPGSFVHSLLRTFQVADPINVSLLSVSYRNYGWLYTLAATKWDGIEFLKYLSDYLAGTTRINK